MSGGHFDYVQYRINDAADKLYEYIQKCESDTVDEYGYKPEHQQQILKSFKNIEVMLRVCSISLQRVDWLISGDDGDEDFLSRLEEDLNELEKELGKRE